MSKGIPMLWQGEEFAENYFLPDFGEGRVALLRPLRWDYFYDGSGQPIATLVRKLLRIRRELSHIRRARPARRAQTHRCLDGRGAALSGWPPALASRRVRHRPVARGAGAAA